jgi:hypothetical protein
MAYTSAETTETNTNDKGSTANYSKNSVIGDAVKETSTAGTGSTSWYGSYSCFAENSAPFLERGGVLNNGSKAGWFSLYESDGGSGFTCGFRPVLVAK